MVEGRGRHAQNAETFEAARLLPVAHGQALVDLALGLEPGNRFAFPTERIDELQPEALPSREDAPVADDAHFTISEMPALLHQLLEPCEGIRHERRQRGARLGTCRLEAVGRRLQGGRLHLLHPVSYTHLRAHETDSYL